MRLNKLFNNEKGIGLVVSLAITAVLFVAALQVVRLAGESAIPSMQEKHRFQAYQSALSGINIAKLLLTEDGEQNSVDSVQDIWADENKIARVISASGMDILEIKIIDELSKIQVNALLEQFAGSKFNNDQHRIWENLLYLRFSSDKSVDKRDPRLIINSIKDWLDSNDDDAMTGLLSAESDYYQDLDMPYECANGQLNHIDELFNIRGITKELLRVQIMDENNDVQFIDIDLDDVFTVYGMDDKRKKEGSYSFQGKVNINTAPVEVLAALLPQGDEELSIDLVEYREQKDENDAFVNSLEKGWYKNIIKFSGEKEKRFERTIRYSSNIFKVVCKAKHKQAIVKLAAFLKREKDKKTNKWVTRTLNMERL